MPEQEGSWSMAQAGGRRWEAGQALEAATEAVRVYCRLGSDQQTWHREFDSML